MFTEININQIWTHRYSLQVPLPMRCCGRQTCTFDVRNRYLTKCMQPATYYQVYYMCVKGESISYSPHVSSVNLDNAGANNCLYWVDLLYVVSFLLGNYTFALRASQLSFSTNRHFLPNPGSIDREDQNKNCL